MNRSNMMCDLETGVCGVGDEEVLQEIDLNQPSNKITLYYVTDPICSHCWALEPVLNRFIGQYGRYFEMHTVMGGLLEGWHGFADTANGIGKPSDVASHWKEVGEHSRMPIDGTLWIDNPILSSYPPSRVYKIIQRQNNGKANEFLRRAREAVFVFNRNIGESQVLIDIVNQIGLDGQQVVSDSEFTSAQELLEQDFELSSNLGVRGFPTIIMVNEQNKGVKIVGARPLETYVQGLEQISGVDLKPDRVSDVFDWLQGAGLLFSKEIEMMYEIGPNEVQKYVASAIPEQSYHARQILNEWYFEVVQQTAETE